MLTPGRRVQRPTAKSLRPGLESSAHHAGEGRSGGSASSTAGAGRHNHRGGRAKLTLRGPCRRTWEGFVYLALVVAAFSRKVVGWAMADPLRTELVLDAV